MCLNTSPVMCDYTNTDSANIKCKQLQNKPTGQSEIPKKILLLWQLLEPPHDVLQDQHVEGGRRVLTHLCVTAAFC